MLLFVFFPFPSEIYIGSSFTETPVEKTMVFFLHYSMQAYSSRKPKCNQKHENR